MHKVLVNRLGGLSLPRKSVVRLTDRPDMTLDVYRGRKTTIQYNTMTTLNPNNQPTNRSTQINQPTNQSTVNIYGHVGTISLPNDTFPRHSEAVNQYFVHILLPVTDNCLFYQRKEKRKYVAGPGIEPGPLPLESDALPIAQRGRAT